ncbi:MFS transporter [Saccharopolyspora sp. WRP15-2]|uniref:MFS transporter n=1 Tax=Saccharopolyspora oryzae TaxID=2997343 RepID=A0ABT4V185_9PSEU|nr:MFS transporter [Saccharopolyspora oryzae]MDA3627712.1 MFS transporter [Saccharopolyspora oryzae]
MNSRIPLYVGGLLGPFGGGIVSAMLPELGRSFGVSEGAAATSLTAYLLPFALVMLVSGSLGERWGLARSIRFAYVGYVLAALLAVVAPWFWAFQVSRALQGVANAFTTPLLLAKLAAVTPKDRLGRALGTYGAMQAIGQTTAPLVGGLAAEGAWQWAFVGLAAVAAVLAVGPLPADEPDGERREPARLRDAWRSPVLLVGGVAFVSWASLAGLPFLVSFRLDDAFSLSPGARGLVLTGFGFAGAITARLTGGAVDRFGPRSIVGAGLLISAFAVGSIGLAAWLPAVVVAWAVSGICAQLVLVGIHATVLVGGSSGGGGVISVVTALRFLGMSASPAVFTGIYRYDAALGFLAPALLLALTIPVVHVWWPRRDRA